MEDFQPQTCAFGDFPYMEILVQPQPKFRFRYKSEMTGKHGSLLGVGRGEFGETMSSTSNPTWSSQFQPCDGSNSTNIMAGASSASGIQSKLFPTVKVSIFILLPKICINMIFMKLSY